MNYRELAEELGKVKRRMAKAADYGALSKPGIGEDFVLDYVMRHKEGVNPKEICDAMGTSSARIAAILRQLEEKNMIARRQSKSDGRCTEVYLLEAGIDKQRSNEQEFWDKAIRMFEALGEADAKEYVRLQKKLIDVYETAEVKKERSE